MQGWLKVVVHQTVKIGNTKGARYHFTDFKNLPNLDFAFICGEHFITGMFMGLCVFRAGNLSKNTSFINFMLHSQMLYSQVS